MSTTQEKVKHTQGEWKAVEAIDQMQFEETTVCRVGRRWWISTTANENGNSEANAKLIAAAPDLLEAMQEIAKYFPLLTLSQMHVGMLEKANAAIKKATE